MTLLDKTSTVVDRTPYLLPFPDVRFRHGHRTLNLRRVRVGRKNDVNRTFIFSSRAFSQHHVLRFTNTGSNKYNNGCFTYLNAHKYHGVQHSNSE